MQKPVNNPQQFAMHPESMHISKVLNTFKHNKKRIRIYYGFLHSGEAVPYYENVSGMVLEEGRLLLQERKMKRPTKIKKSKIVNAHIVGIKDRHTWYYKHPTLNLGKWELQHNISKNLEVTNDVIFNGKIFVRCDTKKRALKFIDFMLGDSMLKPNKKNFMHLAVGYEPAYVPEYHIEKKRGNNL